MNIFFRTTVLSCAIGASLALIGCAGANESTRASDRTSDTRSVGRTIDDATITASVKTKLLEDDRTEGFDINVDTMNGRVTLRGGADSASDRMTAGDVARTTDGVVSVDNQIIVARAGTERRQSANQATNSGEVREAAEEAGDEMSDGWITSKVKAQLIADSDIAGLSINVETEDKVVRLIGNVPSASVRAEALRIATATEGVTKVDGTRLVVRQGGMRP